MAISCVGRNTYTILPLLLLLILIITPSTSSLSPTDIVTNKFLNELCSVPESTGTSTRRFCITWLTTGHKTTAMNIYHLLELTVEKTRAFGLETQTIMSDLAKLSGNDPQLKKSLVSCVQSYGVSIKKLEEAKEFVSRGSLGLAFNAVAKSHENSYVCKDEFEGPSNEPVLALNRSDKFISVSYILWILAELLVQ